MFLEGGESGGGGGGGGGTCRSNLRSQDNVRYEYCMGIRNTHIVESEKEPHSQATHGLGTRLGEGGGGVIWCSNPCMN